MAASFFIIYNFIYFRIILLFRNSIYEKIVSTPDFHNS